MKILAVADEEAAYYYDFYRPGKLSDIDLIVACGDLNKNYLEFLVTMARCPLIYVCGNHDDSIKENPPEGCICIEDNIFEYQGLRFLGLGGSYRYKKDSRCMYTEKQMRGRILRLWPKLCRHKGFDVLVTHAPVYNLTDLNDLPHRGFACFTELLDKYKPKYMFHGHVHMNYGMKIPVRKEYKDTVIINAYDHQILNID